MTLQLNVDATVIASPFGIVPADLEVVFQFDASGNLIQPAKIYSNAELNPQNNIGLGTYYLVTFYDSNGARINASPMWFQFPEVAGSTVDISEVTPFASVGGNIIFYPTSLIFPPPTPTTLGGVFSNAGAPNEFVVSINTNGSVTLAQPSFANLSGQISSAQIPSGLTFAATAFSGLITARAGIEIGVVGTTSGQITLDGATSGQAFITAPAVAATVANPITFSNSINIPSGAVFSINGVALAASSLSNGTTGTGSIVLSASPTFTGTIVASIIKAGFQDTVQTATGATDAIIFPGAVFITTAGVDATTLATPVAGPTDDGKKVTVFDAGGHAHTITTAAGIIVPAHHLVTFGGTAGAFIEFEAFNGFWYPKSNFGVTIS